MQQSTLASLNEHRRLSNTPQRFWKVQITFENKEVQHAFSTKPKALKFIRQARREIPNGKIELFR